MTSGSIVGGDRSFSRFGGAILKTLAFLLASFAAIFSASAGYGLLEMLLAAISRGAEIGVAEAATHGASTVAFFALAGLCAYGAKRCFW